MRFNRRLALLLAMAAAAVLPAAYAQQMPPLIKLVVPYPPGGSADTTARLLAQPLQDELKTTVVVENRPGAGGRDAASQLRRDPADGSVILIAPNALTTIQSLVYAGKLDYNVLDDFTPVSRLVSFPLGLAVSGTSSIRNAADLKAFMSANSASANFGSPGAGGMAHFAGLTFGKVAGIEWTHVAFKGGAPLITDMIGGHIPVGVDALVDQIEFQRAGKIRVLGIFSAQRYPLAPEIPTFAEQGIKMAPVEGWFGAFAPAKTPKETVARIDRAIGHALADPQMKAKLNKIVLEPSYLPSAEFARLQADELKQWAPVVRDSGFTPE